MKALNILILVFITFYGCQSQKTLTSEVVYNNKEDKIKLVVGVTVDQMRLDYIYRYWDKYSDDGFKKLINEGFFFKNAHYSYKPTYTAPGHATIYTGTTPTTHGIIGNNWYDKSTKQTVYCASDTSVYAIGSKSKAGQMSPRRMLTTTITDELRLSTGMKSKSIGISLKDRGAILPAGHSANAAYWYDASTGDWISSSYYMEKLPEWMQDWNNKRLTDQYLSTTWETLRPVEEYIESIIDNNPFEATYKTEESPTFPHDLNKIKEKEGFGLLPKTPFGNQATFELAKAAITGESLGEDNHPDFLAISFSSTDYIGHQFGPRSIEIEDTYLRLDQDIAELIKYLDAEVGSNHYCIFLTADHGSAETPLYLQNFNIPAGYFDIEKFKREIREHLVKTFGENEWIENISNDQIFLNHDLINDSKHSLSIIADELVKFCVQFDGVAGAITSENLSFAALDYNRALKLIKRGYNQKRSGDIHLYLNPAWMTYFRKGTTHGTSYSYDTNVPIIFYGSGIGIGASYEEVNIIDIAPTISALLQIAQPNGSSGSVLSEIFNN